VVINCPARRPLHCLPDSGEQSDLNLACFRQPRDAPRVVIAPAEVEECFYTAIEAVNIARKYQCAGVLLSDQGYRHASSRPLPSRSWRARS